MTTDRFPRKDVNLGGYPFKLHGIAPDERYFAEINDEFETDFYALCRQFILPNYVCIDVGANIGVKSLFLSRFCHLGRVVAIEASNSVAQCLAANVTANGATNLIIEQAAVGPTCGSVHFFEASAWGHISQNGKEIPMSTLENIVERQGLERVDFIKLDIEGSEFSVMQSSIDLINHFQSLVLVELNSFAQLCVANTSPRDFIDWIFQNFSYVFALRKRGTGDLLEPIRSRDSRVLLMRNMIHDGCVTDLLVTNETSRIVSSPAYLEEQLRLTTEQYRTLQIELNKANAQRDEANAQRDAANAQRDALRNSASWRVTAPLRWIRNRRYRV